MFPAPNPTRQWRGPHETSLLAPNPPANGIRRCWVGALRRGGLVSSTLWPLGDGTGLPPLGAFVRTSLCSAVANDPVKLAGRSSPTQGKVLRLQVGRPPSR